jgi:beta-N-acetylhexosaminidase
LLREELKFDGVILSDDLEMKAISAKHDVPEAAVDAIRAGCDAVLICSGDIDLQGRTLEALVRAVESGQIPSKRHDDAFARQKRIKQRFLIGDRPGPRARIKQLRGILGREEHQLVAAEMAAYL